MTKALDALVVGGGPTGLTMAGELARRGLQIRLLDKALEPPPDHSRALAVQARTMEIFEQMGLAQEVIARGRRAEALNLFLPGGGRARLPLDAFSELSTPFPEIRVIQQHDTEAVLASRLPGLGVKLERGVALVSYTQDDGGITATLRRTDGETEEVRSTWLLGCDGAHSQVRKGADIAFEGDTYDDQCLLGDVILDWPMPDGEIYISPTRRGVAAAFPVPGERRFRVVLILPEARTATASELSLEEFAGTMRGMVPVAFNVEKAIVLSRYRLHHRVATHLRRGRVFLSGDAAHIHSPAGGQGMNTGIQDAYNLAWKLAAVEKGVMPSWVLDTYEAERLPVARRLVNFTDRAFGFLAGHGVSGRALRAIAPRLIARLFALPLMQRRVTGFVSQLQIRYRKSPLSVQLGEAPRRGPRAGDRAPDGTLRDATGAAVRVFELIRGLEPTLLLFTGQRTAGASGAAVEQARAVAKRLGGPAVKAVIIGGHGAGETTDPEGRVHESYGVEALSAVLVRPDGYIGLRCDPLREDALDREMARRFTRGS
jgi:2-polyprenyl-6-methoxyphenol hydroxylase-like FAD-dependent oxidoreductase